ncbi:hypothetical protein ACKUB1_11925 [Methanospirillum stamsii]|uniref:hypothetical protein n=1 Tax=Methanospirillum stamsii TaxID=1277351 RepID=UPI000D6F9940|nr:hypothetical protein [Methanospirillum stamsii]
MKYITACLFLGVLLFFGIFSVVCAEETDDESVNESVDESLDENADVSSSSDEEEGLFSSICTQPYALCNTAFCVPDQDDPTKMRCSCTVEKGPSIGKSCDTWEPVGIYMDEYGDWMIKAGYSVGQITSTYSFAHAAPLPKNEIDPNNTPYGYSGDVYLKPCMNETGEGVWADCWDAPCTVLPQDINADISTDRLASPYAVCDCGLKVNQSEWYIGVHGTELCDDPNLCHEYIISGAGLMSTDVGVKKLAEFIKENPDPTEPYKEGHCEDCLYCASNTSAESL